MRLDVCVNIPQRPPRCRKRGLRQIDHPGVAPNEQLRRVEHLQAAGQITRVERLCGAGFTMETFRMTPEAKVWHGLLRDLWLHVASRELLPPATGAASVREARG